MAVKKLKNLSCPFCGGTEFVKGRTIATGRFGFQGAGAIAYKFIAPLRSNLFDFRLTTQPEICVYCKNCGSLVRTYIQHPEMLDHNQE